jgi:WD40 repeat protein
VTALAFSHDGKRLAAGRGDVLHLGDTAGSEWNVSLQGHAGPLSEIRFSPDDRRVAASSRDGRVYVWPVTDRPIDKEAGWSVAEGLVEKDAKLPLKRPSRVQFSFAEDGVRILATDGSPYTRLDDGGASLIWSLLALDGEKFDLSASYTNLFSCSLRHNVMVFYDQGRIAVHDVVKGSPLFQTDLNGAMVVVYPNPGLSTWRRPSEFVILSRDRSYAACVGIAGVWDRRTGDWAWTREKGLGMSAFSEKYGLLVGSGSTDPLDLTNGFFPRELVQIYSARTGDKVLELAGGRPFPNCDAFTLHPNGDAIAILRKHEVEIRDLQQYRVLTKFTDFMPEGCSFAPSGGLVAIKGKGVVAIQELTTGRIRCKFDCTSPVVFSPDGARVITAEGGGIVLRDTANGQVLLHLPGPATEFAFSPDGSAIVSVGSRAAKIWVADRPEASPVPNEAGPRRTPQRR